jgi:putative ABC transport system permease protein
MKKINFTTVEELLASESFLKWYQQTDEKDVQVWNEWIAESPDHQRLVDEAIQLLGLIRSEMKSSIGDREITEEAGRLTNTIRNMRVAAFGPADKFESSIKSFAMIKNYLKIAWRNLVRNKGYSAINIGGLAIGMAVVMLIALWIHDELSFNKSHKNFNRIVRVMRNVTIRGETFTGAYNPFTVSSALRSSFASDFEAVATSTWPEEHTLAVGENKFNQVGNFMESSGPELLTLEMISGSRSALTEINSILLSESSAKKLFGRSDPINKTVRIDNQSDVKVTGVYKDVPSNSEFKGMSFVSTLDLYLSTRPWIPKNDWESNHVQVLAQLSPHADVEKVSEKIRNIMPKSEGKEAAALTEFMLHPMNKWHLYEEFKQGVNTGGRIQFVWLFGIIGVFVLLLACINFMNLSTARSQKRAREVGIRKTIGSLRNQLISQFLSESLLVTSMAFLLSIGLVQLILPWFNKVADKEISVLWDSPLFWILSIGFTFFTGLIAGSYPALYLSSFQPVKVLKGTFRVGQFASIPRKVLVVIQFAVSVALIIGTIVVYQQVQFTKNRSMGYSSSRLIYLEMKTNEIHDHYDAVRNDLLATGAVSNMAESSGFVTKNSANFGGFEWRGKDPGFLDNFTIEWVNHDYGKTVGWQFTEGRDFSRTLASDSSAYIINEAAAKYMKLENPVGEVVWNNGKSFTIIGVIKDVVSESPYKPVRPMIASIIQWPGYTVSLKLSDKLPVEEALAKVETVFKKYVHSMPFDYKFADTEYAKKFEAEVRIGKLSGFFSILAVLISCLGLFGLASFIAEQRTKEIGVRKVLGASVFNLWRMLSKEFIALVIISCFIAIPVAYYFLHEWLQNYEYRTEISWWILAGAGACTLLITLLTVSFQAIKAAIANPIKSLRTE